MGLAGVLRLVETAPLKGESRLEGAAFTREEESGSG
jgi:hypothetical protein